MHILGSTQTEYEDSASHPSVVMPSVWDFGGVNTNVPGVYKVTGSFQAPEGYTLDPDAKLDSICLCCRPAPDQPQVQTCAMAGSSHLFFPHDSGCLYRRSAKGFSAGVKVQGSEDQPESDSWYMTREACI